MPCPKNKSKRKTERADPPPYPSTREGSIMLRISNLYDVTTPSHTGEGWGGVRRGFRTGPTKLKNTNTPYLYNIYTTMEWFECKVRYDKTQENGLIKSTKEAYLVDALSFTEAEETITKEMEPFMSGEFVVSDIKRARIAELFENEDLNADRWYRVKVGFISFDEKSEKEKVITQTDLVQATDLKNAIETLEKGMQGTLGDYKIISVTETPLIDVFRHKVEE